MRLKFCANLSFMFQESNSLLERYSLAKECGFSAVELAFPYDYAVDDVKKAKEREGLQQILINSYPGDSSRGEFGFAALPGKEEDFRSSVDRAITYAKALDCKKIHIIASEVDSPTLTNDEVYKKNLSWATKQLEKERIMGLIEPIGAVGRPKYYMNSFEKALSLICDINSPNLKMQLDMFHLQTVCGNLTHNLRRYLPHTGHIQISQVPNRHEPDTAGELNYDYIFDLLTELNYSDWIGLEYFPAADTKSGLKWLNLGETTGGSRLEKLLSE